mgnify:CR=1 FL=1
MYYVSVKHPSVHFEGFGFACVEHPFVDIAVEAYIVVVEAYTAVVVFDEGNKQVVVVVDYDVAVVVVDDDVEMIDYIGMAVHVVIVVGHIAVVVEHIVVVGRIVVAVADGGDVVVGNTYAVAAAVVVVE